MSLFYLNLRFIELFFLFYWFFVLKFDETNKSFGFFDMLFSFLWLNVLLYIFKCKWKLNKSPKNI